MRQWRRAISAGVMLVLVLGFLGIEAPSARAQMATAGAGRSLGGYGADTISRYYSSGMSSYIPYNGSTGGFVSNQGGYAGGFGYQPISRGLGQTPIGGLSMPMTPVGGASSFASGMQKSPARELFTPFGYEGGIGLGSGMIGAPMTSLRAAPRPSGPGFGYPFRMPAPLGGEGSGMAVMAP